MSQSTTTVAGSDRTMTLLFKGFLVGIANIIPGVSGGTFALILGLFDRMINALHAVGVRTVLAAVGLVLRGSGKKARQDFVDEWRRTDAWFLVRILIGALASILICSELLKFLLQEHPGVTLSFFLGLIIPSLAVPWGMMQRRGAAQLFWVLPGIALTVGVSLAFGQGGVGGDSGFLTDLVVACVSGAVAISAMILPGVSGSFVMLVLGQYQKVLEHLSGVRQLSLTSFTWLAALAVGCVVGLLLFSRLLHWLLKRWRSATMAFLIGLVLGSFWVLWPCKDFEKGSEVRGRKGNIKRGIQVATAPQRLPNSWTEVGKDGLALAIGLGCAVGLESLGRRSRKQETSEVEESGESGGG